MIFFRVPDIQAEWIAHCSTGSPREAAARSEIPSQHALMAHGIPVLVAPSLDNLHNELHALGARVNDVEMRVVDGIATIRGELRSLSQAQHSNNLVTVSVQEMVRAQGEQIAEIEKREVRRDTLTDERGAQIAAQVGEHEKMLEELHRRTIARDALERDHREERKWKRLRQLIYLAAVGLAGWSSHLAELFRSKPH